MKQMMCDYMRRLCDTGLTTSLSGNISCLDEKTGHILVTPSGVDKYSLTEADIVTVDRNGVVVEGSRKPTMEYLMHVGVYRARPETRAVFHAHPTFSTLYSALDEPINLAMTLEVYKAIGEIRLVEVEIMGTPELAARVEEAAHTHWVLLLRNHGPVTCGTSLQHAFNLLELTEMAAKLTWLAEGHSVRVLPEEKRAILRAMMKR